MNSQTILIIAAVFGAGFLMMIPFAIMQSRRKKQAQSFAQNNAVNALLHLYATDPVIDGTPIKDMQFVRGANLQYTVALVPGPHTISAKYSATSMGLSKNINYKTPKPITSQLALEAGREYTMGISFYSPQQEMAEGASGKPVFSQELEVNSGGAGFTKAYITCYQEN